MDNERRKRKMEKEDEEDEEEKMEKFFALIRSTRDIREHAVDRSKAEGKRAAEPAAIWNPSFKPEDFMDENERFKAALLLHPIPALPGPSTKKDDENRENDDKDGGKGGGGGDGLDLNLSL